MQRKLASIVVVDRLSAIPGADAIELAHVAGWQCVVKKGEFSAERAAAGERGLYLEIDCVPPDTAAFRWLWQPKKPDPSTSTPAPRPPSFRIRTMRLRGQLSQGLLLPLAAFPELRDAAVGDDVAALLGITKYEPPAPAGVGAYRAPFPGVVPKTDEMRVQAMPAVLDELRGKPWVATEKCDGTSATFVVVDGALHCCSRNLSVLDDGASFYWHIARKTRLDVILADAPHLAVQGEIVGPGIQKNPMGTKEKELRVFSVFDTAKGAFFSDRELREFCAKHALVAVDVVAEGDAFDESVASLLALAEGHYPGTMNEREGIVVRPRDGDLYSPLLGGRLSFKAISNRFLLAES
jgi:RNA ligase (TIGR02306 family)